MDSFDFKKYINGELAALKNPATADQHVRRRLLACAADIEASTRIRSGLPAFLHPLIRLCRYKQTARTTAEALRTISGVLMRHERLLAPPPPPQQPASRFLIDVTYTHFADNKTGIQRVVRNLARELMSHTPAGHQVRLVQMEGGILVPADGFGEKIGVITRDDAELGMITPTPQDTLLLADSGWPMLEDYLPVLRQFEQAGALIVGIIYDLIPLTHPAVMHGHKQCMEFARWFAALMAHSTCLIAISESTANDLIFFADRAFSTLPKRIPVAHFHLGAEGAELSQGTSPEIAVPERVQHVRNSARHVFLMVGTIEPRKGHLVVLDAFEKLWATGIDASLLIVGKRGWKTELAHKKILRHRMRGKKLFWLEKASDLELVAAYSLCDCLVAASMAEGFGLPLIEAAQHGLPIIASDIAVFKEVCQTHAAYFKSQDSADLAQVIRDWIATKEQNRPVSSRGMRWMTWSESAADLLKVIAERDWKAHVHPA